MEEINPLTCEWDKDINDLKAICVGLELHDEVHVIKYLDEEGLQDLLYDS